MKDLLVILAILIFCFEIYHLLRENWIRRFLRKRKGASLPGKPRVMKPKSERDCPFCVKEKGEHKLPQPGMPKPWRLRKGRGGPKKRQSTPEYFCPNPVTCPGYLSHPLGFLNVKRADAVTIMDYHTILF